MAISGGRPSRRYTSEGKPGHTLLAQSHQQVELLQRRVRWQ